MCDRHHADPRAPQRRGQPALSTTDFRFHPEATTSPCFCQLLPQAFLPPKGSDFDRVTQPLPVSYSPALPRLRLPGATRIQGRQRFPR